jgi:acetyltransferase-like isoleucine patch superfamily enzyme
MHGGRLEAEVHPSARIDGPIELNLLGEGEGEWELSLELGPQAWLGRGVGIELARGPSTLRAGDGSRLGTGVRCKLLRGDIDIAPRAHVREYTRLQVHGRLEIGRDVAVGFGSHVYCQERIELRERCGLAHGVTVIDHDHDVDGSETWWANQPLAVDPVVIGRNTIVSAGARVLRGARLGANSVVGANAVVRAGEYPDRSVLVGSPARVVKTLG